MPFLSELVLGVLLVAAPVLGVVQARSAGVPAGISRVSVYMSSAVVILLLGGVSAAAGVAGFGPASMGLGRVARAELAGLGVWTAAVTALVLTLLLLSRRVGYALGLADPPLLVSVFPKTRRERRYFTALSFVAGTGEEVAYRGFAITALGALSMGPWAAAVVTSVAFGLLHCYQGVRGVVGSGLAGFVFAAAFIRTGSLWPAIAGHILVDLVAGLVLGEKMLIRGDGETSACA